MDSENANIFVRIRCVITHEDKLLVSYSKEHDYYFFPGGHMQWGESIVECSQREIREELGEDVQFDFKKILFVREMIEKEKEAHSLELFVLGKVNKYKELEGKIDPEHTNGLWWSTWLDLENLPNNLLPPLLAQRISKEYKDDFPSQGEYVGTI